MYKSSGDDQYGSIAQLGEHLPYKQRVTGSSPVVPTPKKQPLAAFLFYRKKSRISSGGVSMKNTALRFLLLLIIIASAMTCLCLSGCKVSEDSPVTDTWADDQPLAPESVDGFTNSSWWERVGGQVKVSASAYGGKEPYTYMIYFKRSTNNKWNPMTTEYSTKSVYYFKPEISSDYHVRVTVKDSNGKECGKILEVRESSPLLINTSKAEQDQIKLGAKINIKAGAKGGTAPYTYAYYYKSSQGEVWKPFGEEAYTSQTTASFKPRRQDTYSMKIIVKDTDSQAAEEKLEVKVTD